MAGRGFGKTKAGAEWVRHLAESRAAERIALVGPTEEDTRLIMIEGDSGILAVSKPWFRPDYTPSIEQLTWPNGVIATCYSADEPDGLRGHEHDHAWIDEPGAWSTRHGCLPHAHAGDAPWYQPALGRHQHAAIEPADQVAHFRPQDTPHHRHDL